MGGACTKSHSRPHKDKVVTRRLGNLTFQQYGTCHAVSKTIGKGCRQTPAWKTESTRQDVILKREEYWDTRTQGDPNTWRVIRMACEAEDPGTIQSASAQAIIQAAGLRMPQGSILLCYDAHGLKYELPPYVVNEADEYGTGEKLPPVPTNMKEEMLEVTVRSAHKGDVKMHISSLTTGRQLKDQYVAQTESQSMPRMFYGGREITDEVLLAQRQVTSGVVIQAMGA